MSEREIVCEDLGLALDDLRRQGLRLDVIYPADDPHTAILSGDGRTVRLTTRPDAPGISRGLPPFRPQFIVTRAHGSAGQGRAGMLYRDLIPGRLGGRYIASHIIIPEGGPVSDWVHYHHVTVQMIVVRTGWIRVVYEDQGEPFVMEPGDLVLQPPGIRHRVLESSPGLEVVEISAPAVHETFADHELQLPNGHGNPARLFGGQRFLHRLAGEGPDTGLTEATGGLADADFPRLGGGDVLELPAHDGELVFGFVMEGSATLEFGGSHGLGPADAFVIPPGERWSVTAGGQGLGLLHVTTARMG